MITNLNQKIEDLQNQINAAKIQLEKEMAAIATLTEAQQVAIMLHDKFCRDNHVDMCDWYYHKNDWDQRTHKEWLEKAKRLLKVVKKEEIIKILTIL